MASGLCQAVGMAKKRTKADRLERQTEQLDKRVDRRPDEIERKKTIEEGVNRSAAQNSHRSRTSQPCEALARRSTSNELKGNNMDAILKAKLDEARERINGQQAGINANRKHHDPAMREWARGRQRPANAERAKFRNSLTDDDRSQIEERLQQLTDDNPALSSMNARTLDSKTEPPSVPVEVLDEYYFLRDMVG